MNKKILAALAVSGIVAISIYYFSGTIKKGYVLSEKEKILINWLMENDASTFLDGGGSIIGNDLTMASARDVAKAYAENQVAADQAYYNKILYVTGAINSINSGFGNKPYVEMGGTNSFLGPQVHFKRGVAVDKIADLKKGQKIGFVCRGGGAIAGTPIFNECEFADEYANQKQQELLADLEGFLMGGNNKLEITPALSVMVILSARVLPEDSSCYGDQKNCRNEIDKYIKDPNQKSLRDSIQNELKVLGIKVNS